MAIQWLQNYWTKEGAGISKDAPKRKGLGLFTEILGREWWEIVKLNILFLLTSLFIITIPAAIFAMASVTHAFVEDRNVYLLRDFIEGLKRYWIRATIWALALGIALGIGTYTSLTYGAATGTNLAYAAALTISLCVTLFLLVVAIQFMVLSVCVERPALETIRLAAIATLVKPLPVLGAILFVCGLWLAHILLYPVSVFMPAAFNFSLGMFAILFGAHGGAMQVLALPKGNVGN